jgi:hypothetical protein
MDKQALATAIGLYPAKATFVIPLRQGTAVAHPSFVVFDTGRRGKSRRVRPEKTFSPHGCVSFGAAVFS